MNLDILNKIKKLLALSTGEGTTAEERNLALNRAKSLMAQHSVSERDLNAGDPKDQIILREYHFKSDNPLPSYLHDPMLFNTIISPICNNFGCYAAVTTPNNCHIIYGFPENIEISMYACDVIINQGIKDFREQYKEIRSIGFALTFWTGFTYGLMQRFAKLSDERAIVLYDKVKDSIPVEAVFVSLPYSNEQSGNAAGQKSAMNAQLHDAIRQGYKGNKLT